MKKVSIAILLILFLLGVAQVFATGERCPHCDEAVEWTQVTGADWAAGGALKTGHYRLSEAISLTAALTVAPGETVCVDLRGFDITQTAERTGKSYTLRVFENSGTLTLMDSTARTENGEYISGRISGGSCYAGETNGNTHGGNIWCGEGSEFNLYSGAITDGAVRRRYHSPSRFAGGNLFSRGTVNLYGGVIREGRVYSDYLAGTATTGQRQIYVAGGNVAVSGGALNIYGGIITGGSAENRAVAPAAPGLYEALGGNVYVNNTQVLIAGGEISNGAATSQNQGADNATVTQVSVWAQGGNFYATGKGEVEITGGVITGGVAEALVEAYPEKTLTKRITYGYGGNIWTGETVSLRIFGGENTNGTACRGGCIYTDGTLHINDGKFSGGKAVASPTDESNYGGLIYGKKKIYIYGGEYADGQAKRGGNLFGESYLTVAGGLIRDGVATDRGGNIGIATGYLIIEDGLITGGSGNRLFGGNIWCTGQMHLYGGQIADPVSGGNVTLMSKANGYIYGGSITGGGLYGYDSLSTLPGNLYFYGGKVDYVRTGAAGTNNIQIWGGSIGGFVDTAGNPFPLEALDANANGQPVVAPCAHLTENDGYTVWHHFDGYCQDCGHTFGAAACDICKQVHTNLPGSHSYQNGSCVTCGYNQDGSHCALVEQTYYTSLEEALSTGGTVKLVRDLELRELSLYGTLDLAGHILTVTDVLGAENKDATLIDSVGTGGVAGKLYVRQDNPQLPVPVEGIYRLEPVAMTQTLEKLSDDAALLKFVITDTAENTWLDNATVVADAYKVRIRVTWTENGEEKVHFFCYSPEMVAEYAAAWGEKMFTCTITGLSDLEDHTVTAQLVTGGTVDAKDITPPATTSVSRYESGPGFITPMDMPTRETIAQLPQKYPGMPVDEARQVVVAFMDYAKSFTWVPDRDETYWISSSMGYHNLNGNSLYGGLPYVTVGTGNIYRLLDYMDPNTGVVDIRHAMQEPSLFGNQCSLGVYYAVSRVINSNHTSAYTAGLNYKNGYIPVGPYTYTLEGESFSENGYDTDDVCAENGEQVMYESYALTQPADGLVSPGHAILCTGLPRVVRNEDGAIDPDRSFLTISDQTNGWSTATNGFGESYAYTRNTRARWSFKELYNGGYIPFTFAEFLGTDPIEETEVTYSHTGQTITRDQLVGSTVTSNYGVSDIYAIFTDSKGNQVYQLAVRSRSSLCRELTFGFRIMVSGVNTSVQWGSLEDLSGEETYTVEIVAQLTTGERPTLWTGAYLAE